MSLTVGLAIGFLSVLMIGLAIGSYRSHTREQARKKQPNLIIEHGYRRRRDNI